MKKIIIINSYKEYKKFLRKIKYYKTIIFYNTIFKLDSSIENEYLDSIVESLNIKNRKERIEYVYDRLCNIFDEKMELGICKFKNNKCIVQQKNRSKSCNGCCLNCSHQKNKVCNTQNLACKLFYCPRIKKSYSVLKMKDIPLFKLLSARQKIILKYDFFSSREELLRDLYSYSFLFTTIKILNRSKKNYISRK